MFDEKEARVALGLGFIPFAVDQVARRAGLDPKQAESQLESLADKDMKQKLKEFDDVGLVRQVNNTRDRLEFVRHCCACCCRLLSALTEFDNSGEMANL